MGARPRTTNRFALTGTPGTGKSSAASLLPSSWTVDEVGELAMRWGAGREIRDGIEVDLVRLRRRISRAPASGRPWVIVGHLAHLLPVDGAVVLRCQPFELERRLAESHRGTAATRRANAIAEATDVVLVEALAEGATVWEIDTTGRASAAVAQVIARRVRSRGPCRYGTVDWLGDPNVTAHLLDARP